MRILVIEDEPQLAGSVARSLKRAGHEVEVSHDGAEGFALAKARGFDLVVLDVNLPTLDGFTLLKKMREQHNPTRVLLLTARSEVADRINGLNSGADDYLTKPFAMGELLARVEALGRRTPTAENHGILRHGDLWMDVLRRKVTRGGEPVALSPREFELLHIFMREPGRTFSREEICTRIWEREHEYDTRTVEIFIMRLRRKLGSEGAPPVIETIRGAGYALNVQP